jgi:hypothetical protein
MQGLSSDVKFKMGKNWTIRVQREIQDVPMFMEKLHNILALMKQDKFKNWNFWKL